MIPAGVIDRVDDDNRKVYVVMSKDDIKSAPDFSDQDRDVRDPYDTPTTNRSAADREVAKTTGFSFGSWRRADGGATTVPSRRGETILGIGPGSDADLPTVARPSSSISI